MVSPPDVLDTESARGHPRPVLYHLWTKVAARSCLIEEAPEPTAASARVLQAPYGTLTRVAPLSVLPASR
jgi:hypothetical protein